MQQESTVLHAMQYNPNFRTALCTCGRFGVYLTTPDIARPLFEEHFKDKLEHPLTVSEWTAGRRANRTSLDKRKASRRQVLA